MEEERNESERKRWGKEEVKIKIKGIQKKRGNKKIIH